MSVVIHEGVIDHGQIKLKSNTQLPDNIKVYVLVPRTQVAQFVHLYSPRLAHPEQSVEFKMEVVKH